MTSAERKDLENIYKIFINLEKSTPAKGADFHFDSHQLAELKNLIRNLAQYEDPEISRLANIEKHLHEKMTLKHFVSFMIPFERLLNKTLKDDDFLIIANDRTAQAQEKLPLLLVLDNIRSAFNVGSIFRTAECLGAEKVILCGYTPLPTQWKVEKTAMGTHEYMDWEEGGKIFDTLERLRNSGYRLVGLETAESATDLYEEFQIKPTAFILGNERFGLDSEVLKNLDEIRIIPLRGRKNSLNVGVTAALAGFEWMRQWRTKTSH